MQDEEEDEDEEMQDDAAVNGTKPQENGMDVEEKDGSDLFDGDEDEGDAKETRRVADDDDYD